MKPHKMHHCALVKWGAQTIGKRAGTKLACIETFDDKSVEVTFVRCFTADGRPVYYNRSRRVSYSDVIESWFDWPEPWQIRKARQNMEVCK